MRYQKNDQVCLKITDMGNDGEGIGRTKDGYTLFVKDTVIGDEIEAKVIKAKKNYGYGKLMKILQPSADRVEPLCPKAGPCGGCQLQALSYKKQLEYKQNRVRNHLERIGGFTEIPMEPIIGMEEPYHYRNKAQFPVGRNKEGRIITGFYAGRTHSIVENRKCYLGVTGNEEILKGGVRPAIVAGAEGHGEGKRQFHFCSCLLLERCCDLLPDVSAVTAFESCYLQDITAAAVVFSPI